MRAGVERLPDDIGSQVKPIWDMRPQSDENMRGRLFVPD
jgi:hypothetical protein